LLQNIKSGTYKTGELLPTDIQIAEKFGTSRPTVSKSVQRLVNENLLSRKAGFGTYLSETSNGLDYQRELNFALLIPDLGKTEIFEPICGQIASLAHQHHFNLLWGGGPSGDSITSTTERLASKYIKQKVDGVFFAPLECHKDADAINVKISEAIRAAEIPLVLLDNDIFFPPKRSAFDMVGLNNIEAGFLVASHLISSGCKKIGFINKPNIAGTVHRRLMGVQEAFRAAGISEDGIDVITIDKDIATTATAIACRKDLDALIICNDATAAELMTSLIEVGVKIPNDLKIAAFDDVKYASLLTVPLTTVRQPCSDIASAAVEAMLSRVNHPSQAARSVLLSGELVVRKSAE